MSSDVALRIEGLGKKYTIRHKDHDHVTLAQAALHRIRHPRGAVGKEEFWALRDVSLEVPRGQVLGVIGHNGAGKSTLLKILSRITPPTTGKVEVFGRIGSLLEVGTGFHPELTGRENIYLNGSILGMRTKEIDRQFDAIVDFSGVEKFLDTPVKRYSSGMYVRLAFAVAAHLDTEILLMDEVLAVGDAEFQKKSIASMRDAARAGRTVLIVSHHMATISNLCDEVVWLHSGIVRAIGPVRQVLESFADGSVASMDSLQAAANRRPGTGEFRIVGATTGRNTFATDEPKVLRFDIAHRDPNAPGCYLLVRLRNSDGAVVVEADSRLWDYWVRPHAGASSSQCELRINSPWLKPGSYTVHASLHNAGLIDEAAYCCQFSVDTALPYPALTLDEAIAGNTVLPDFRYVAVDQHADRSPESEPADRVGLHEVVGDHRG